LYSSVLLKACRNDSVPAVLFYSFKVVQGRLVGVDVSTVRSWAF
jgi:hypothetical protein